MSKNKLILTMCAAGISAASAQDVLKKLDPTTIKADEVAEVGPKVIVAEEIAKRSAADLAGVFANSPGVNVNGGRAQAQQIFVNNIESTLLNVTIDGASVSNVFHHAASVQVEPELLKQVDVVAGAGTALDGPGALAGSIRFETKNAFDLLDEGQQWGGLSRGIYYSNGDGFKLSQSFYTRLSPNWAFLLSGSHTDRDSYKDGNGNTVDQTEYTRESYLAKLSGRYDGGHSFDFGYEHIKDETLAYDRWNVTADFLISLGRSPGLLQRVASQRDTFSFNYGYNPTENDMVDLSTNVFLTEQEFERRESKEFSTQQTLGFDVRNTSKWSSFETTYGIDGRFHDGDVKRSDGVGGFVTGDEQEQSLGLYLQNKWSIGNNVDLHFGARFDSYDYDDIAGKNYDSSDVSPNASIEWRPTDGLSLFAGYSEAYRGVGIRELFLAGDRPADLDGEEAKNWKIGFNYERGAFYSSASVFRQEIDNYLYPIPVGRSGNGSFGDIENEGYEAKIGYRKDNFDFSLGMAYSDPEVKGYAYPDDIGMVVAGRHWIADFNYDFEASGVTVGWTVDYRESVDEVPLGRFPAVAGKSSYILHHAHAEWEVPSVEGLTLGLYVNNIFDEDYQDHTIFTSSGMASPGREIRLSATYEF